MKKGIVSVGILGSVLLLAAGCGNGNADTTVAKSKAANAGGSSKKEISLMLPLHTPAPPTGDIGERIEDYTGLKMKIDWYPDASRDERIQSGLASGTLSDVVFMGGATVRQALSSGMFWDVEDYLKDFPNLSQIPDDRIESAKIEGHLYGIPSVSDVARYGVVVRKDWLDNLNLEVPHTIDDLTEVARAFTEDDPDGNGKDDTVGFVDRVESFEYCFPTLAGYFGAGSKFYKQDDDTIIPSFMQDEFKEAMKWYRGIYENGWMNSDFVVMPKQQQEEYISQGNAGIMVTGLSGPRNFMRNAEGTDEEGMQWALINDMTYKDVPRRIISDTNNGFGGWYAIPKDYVKTEDELKVVLGFLDDMAGEEMSFLLSQGVEGVHYKVNDKGEIEPINADKKAQEVSPYNPLNINSIRYKGKTKSSDPLTEEINEKTTENEKYAVLDPTLPLDSDTYDKEWGVLIEPIKDAYFKYILGDEEMGDFDKAIDKFLSQGGQDVIDEFTESYKKSNK